MVAHRYEANSRFKCGIIRCNKTFKTFYAFDTHISRHHNSLRSQTKKYNSLYTNLRCNRVLCCKKFSKLRYLISHLNSHMKLGQIIQCCFRGCDRTFKLRSSFASHLTRCHSNHKHISQSYLDTGCSDMQQFNLEKISVEYIPSINVNETKMDIKSESTKNFALFCLMLEAKLLIPSSSVQKIVQEFDFFISNESLSFNATLVQKIQSLGLTEKQQREILSCINNNNNLLTILNSENGLLRSKFLREKYFEENFSFVKPVEILLGKDKLNTNRTFHYIPIKDILASLLKNKSFNLQFENPLPSQAEMLSDLQDGILFRSNAAFQDPKVFQLILYQDSFEIVNPLGSARNKHKILAVYFTLNQIYPAYRSSLNQIYLLLLCNEKDIKLFGEHMIFRQLVDDIKELENGSEINGIIVKAAVLCICGDNLGSHFIGGFPQNFSTSDYMCRFCTMKRTDWKEQPYPILNAEKFTKEKYNAEIESIGSHSSIFNELGFFHVCSGLPPCIAHDLFEGIVVADLALYLKYFVTLKKYFTIDDVNQSMALRKYIGTDSICKPAIISKKGFKLIGNASQNWAFLRFLPLSISSKVEASDSVWLLVLKLREIVEFSVSPKLSFGQVMYMKTIIDEYLEDRKILFPNDNLKPKHHFIHHYPELMFHFGPLIKVWTLRFESKHSFFKNVARRSQNYINLTYTLSMKHQLLQAYNFNGSLFPEAVHIADKIKFNINLYNDIIKNTVQHITENNLFFTHNSVQVYGTSYKTGQFLFLDEFAFGEIILILSDTANKVYFVQKIWRSSWCFERGLYVLKQMAEENLKCLEYSDLIDNYPLSMYIINDENIIILKHKIAAKF